MAKNHNTEFLMEDDITHKLVPAKRKSRGGNNQVDLEAELRKNKRLEEINQPLGILEKTFFQQQQLKIHALNNIDITKAVNNYIHLLCPKRREVIFIDEFAYKVYPFKYLIEIDER